ncbi:MAG: hypothetical protein A3F84_08615 [Candidatus Handelsmanbacteria bacterium RIFCSPLOWO2_12_FULL_64_10]|uniref:Lipocalin-like domain-containing protein n=1 Tax=Handelsmanbacteria sp. (strain RIFCSPLOWO2_12_FULL_64_10) TaxID=1817868 RepID=A0A1F6CB64_HANXR|nr:MAG: hypothetical protein A3F84_08615 [Candidatus Handelsmanbacteria bacterium RIFCSPLOWO2_12_FULL_64_10]
MKRTLVSTMGVVVMVALVGCGGSNPAGPGSLTATSNTVQAQISIDPARVSASLEERLIGRWELRMNSDMPSLMKFKRDGEVEVTSVIDDVPVTVPGAYKVNGNRLTLTANVGEKEQVDTSIAQVLSRFVTYFCSINGNTLILTLPDGEQTKWAKT